MVDIQTSSQDEVPGQPVFLKLGGSLITVKSQPGKARHDVISRLAEEIHAARTRQPEMRMVLGHGSGSFGHVVAHEHATHRGVKTPEEWRGFAEVWFQAARLNHMIVEALYEEKVPAIVFPPSSLVTADQGQVSTWDLKPLSAALEAGLVPVVYGDVVFDTRLGGTVLSTEELFSHMAQDLLPARILIAGLEPGVWADYPVCTRVIPALTDEIFRQIRPALQGSAAPDVTGGMVDKVQQMLNLARKISALEICIFSGEVPGQVEQALLGDTFGTVIRSSDPP